jgi:hypothetical protein
MDQHSRDTGEVKKGKCSMDEITALYEFNNMDYAIDEFRDLNGVVVYSCIDNSNGHPVFIRTNGVNVFHYKIGENEGDDEQWGCCTNKPQLVQDFMGSAIQRDEDELIITQSCWISSANALLYYMNWLNSTNC